MVTRYLWALSSVLFLLFTNVYSQYKPNSLANGILPDIIPSSPEASALGKFGQWPVSQYTGLPSISVPIFNVSAGTLQLPVQLSYHAGGVKLDEVASWVGTNWALNAGGVINRSIVGLPDETFSSGFLYRNLTGNGLKESYDVGNVDDYILFRKVDDRQIDVEPDIFTYNFAGFSGKFYFDKQGRFQCIPVNSLKLLRCPLNNTQNYTDQHWEIADPNGNVFFFASYQENDNGFEKTKVFTQDAIGALPFQVSAWYLTKIVLANNADIIYFDYNDKSEIYDLPNSYSLNKVTGYYGFDPYNDNPPAPGTVSNILINGGGGSPSSLATSGKSQLKKIRWKNGEVIFYANTARSDLSSGKMLDSIVVNNNEGTRIKKFVLNYDYLQQRYFLSNVVESGRDASVQLKHTFEYIQPGSLPLRSQSLAQDHWGYYNGANSNVSLLPPVPEINSPSLNANREPNETFMQYGAMSRITYPTGGYTTLEYEAHRYDPASPVGRGNPQQQLTNNTITVKAGEPQPPGYNKTQTFTIPITQYVSGLSLQFTNYNKPPSKELARLPFIKIEKLVGSVYQTVYYWDAYDKFPVGNVVMNSNGLVDFNTTETISLDPGDYRVVADVVCGVTNCGTPVVNPGVTATFTYSTYNGQLPIAGGLRIKQLTNYTNGNFATAKKYTYSPGKLLIYPKYIHQYAADISDTRVCNALPKPQFSCGICTELYAKYIAATSSSQVILGVTQGSIVGYTYVKEQDVTASGNDNGFTDYLFDFTPDLLNIINYDNTFWAGLLNSSVPLTNLDYKRGALLFKDSYKKLDNGSYVKVHSLRNVFKYNDNDSLNRFNSLKGLRINYVKRPQKPCTQIVNGYDVPSNYPFKPNFTFGLYDIVTSWVQSTLTEETVYDANGQNPLRTTTTYAYNNPTHLQVTGTSVTDSKNNTIVTDNKYPSNYATITPAVPNAYNTMIDKNMIGNVVNQKKSIGVQSLSETKTEFKYFPENNIIKPLTVSSGIKGNTLETDLTYNNYDSKGNILQYTAQNGVPTSFEWGYNSSYPVVEIKNAANTLTSTTVIGTLNSSLAMSASAASTSFTTTASGNIIIGAIANAGSTYAIFYTLTGPVAKSGDLCVSRSATTCGYPESVTLAAMPAGTYTLSINLSSGSGAYKGATYSYQGNQTVTTGVKEFFFEGFEANTSANAVTGAAHSGKKYWNGSYTTAFTPPNSRAYSIQWWNLSGGKWQFNKQAFTSNITLTGQVDDIRIFPSDAFINTYTYDPLIGMTSQTDPSGMTTYYEYDNFNRLKNIKDYQGNIIKNFQYNYANSCGANCVVLPMQTFTAYNTPSYPVGVFNNSKQYIGVANSQAQYISLWNSHASNQLTGVLSAGTDSLHFNLSLASNAAAPPAVLGLRYYQWDIFTAPGSMQITTDSLSFIDWGDGSRELVTQPRKQLTESIAYGYAPVRNDVMSYAIWFNHTYVNGQPKTITVFHNETTETVGIPGTGINDAAGQDANIRGYYPEKVKAIIMDQIPNSSDLGIKNFARLTEVVNIHYRNNGTNTFRHNNWQTINHMHKIKWLKMVTRNGNEIFSNARVNFPDLRYFETVDFKPDIMQTWGTGGFANLYIFLMVTNNTSTGSITLTPSETDAIINSQAAANSIANGMLGFIPVPTRSAASTAAYNTLTGRGWTLQITNP